MWLSLVFSILGAASTKGVTHHSQLVAQAKRQLNSSFHSYHFTSKARSLNTQLLLAVPANECPVDKDRDTSPRPSVELVVGVVGVSEGCLLHIVAPGLRCIGGNLLLDIAVELMPMRPFTFGLLENKLEYYSLLGIFRVTAAH